MVAVTQPLRDEHKELYPYIQRLKTAGDAVGAVDFGAQAALIDEAYAFLSGHLIPHALAEDAALYPVVARVMGAPEAPATMRRDHAAVGQLVDELGSLRREVHAGRVTPEVERELRRVLYGLYTLVGVHFAKEEEVYLPLLDAALTPEAAEEMFAAMEHAAHEAKEGVKRNA